MKTKLLIAALMFFVLQAFVVIIFQLAKVAIAAPEIWIAFSAAGAVTYAIMRLVYWRARTAGVPRLIGADLARALLWGLAGGIVASVLVGHDGHRGWVYYVAVDPDSLPESEVELTHIDLNDQTLEGLRHRNLPLFSVQYHPEAAPGPHDSHYLFKEFTKMMEEWKG